MSASMPFTSCYPLWGVTYVHPGQVRTAEAEIAPRLEAIALGVLGGFSVEVPSEQLWHYFANSDVSRESYEWGIPQKPVCLSVYDHVPAAVGHNLFEDIVKSAAPRISRRSRLVVTAMRLFKDGWFLDPVLSERIYTNYRSIVRKLGPYYLYYWDEDIQKRHPYPPYRLSGADLTATAGAPMPVCALTALLELYEDIGDNSSLNLALANFNQMYSCALTPAHRLSLLFTATDAQFLGMSRRRIGEVSLASFRERVATALRQAGLPDADKEADWFDSVGREYRNAIAHGRGPEQLDELDSVTGRAMELLRRLLIQYLSFGISWRTQPELTRRLSRCSSSNVAMTYNALLGEMARGRVEDSLVCSVLPQLDSRGLATKQLPSI